MQRRAFLGLGLGLGLFGCETRKVEDKRQAPPPPPPAPARPAPPVVVAPPPVVVKPNLSLSPMWGKPEAKVTVIAFGDLQCPYCAKGHKALQEMLAVYGNDLRLVWKDLPLVAVHPAAKPAALALRALLRQGEDKFFAGIDLLFARQSELRGVTSSEGALSLLESLPGIDAAACTAVLTSATEAVLVEAQIDVDIALAAALGVAATPTYFINGEPVSGARDRTQFQEVIDRQRSRALDLLARGTPPAELYPALVKDGVARLDKKSSALVKVPVEAVSSV